MQEPGFIVSTPSFSGSLSELAQALRSYKLSPKDIDVLALVRAFLAFYERVAARDLELATETLPQLARVVELKVRLLLPRPRLEPEEEEETLSETLESVDVMAELEEAIHFLRRRRASRRLVLPVKLPRPPYVREEPAIRLPLARLAELAGRYSASNYFELAVERLTLAAAMRGILDGLLKFRRRLLIDLSPPGWLNLSVSFAGMLELVKEGKVAAYQEKTFGPIELELANVQSESQEAA